MCRAGESAMSYQQPPEDPYQTRPSFTPYQQGQPSYGPPQDQYPGYQQQPYNGQGAVQPAPQYKPGPAGQGRYPPQAAPGGHRAQRHAAGKQYGLNGAEMFWYILGCISFGAAYFSKIPGKKAACEVFSELQLDGQGPGRSYSLGGMEGFWYVLMCLWFGAGLFRQGVGQEGAVGTRRHGPGRSRRVRRRDRPRPLRRSRCTVPAGILTDRPAPREGTMRPSVPIAIAAIALIATACSSAGTGTTPDSAASASAASARAYQSSAAAAQSAIASEIASQAATASPTPAAPTKVTFVVSGTAPDGIDITYGPSGSNFAGPSALDGAARMSVKFDPSASYYAMNAQLQGAGDITCKIVVSGPGDDPATVSKGAARGGFNICDVQAAPADSTGLSWESEN